MRLAALASVALALLVPSQPTPLELGRGYVVQRQQPDGGFAEPEGSSDPALTAWAVVAIRAAGRDPSKLRRGGASPADYLASRPATTANRSELAATIFSRMSAPPRPLTRSSLGSISSAPSIVKSS